MRKLIKFLFLSCLKKKEEEMSDGVKIQIDSVNYVCLDAGYINRLILPSSGVPDISLRGGIEFHKYKELRCKENHNATTNNNYSNDQWDGQYSCVDDTNTSCDCCSYYNQYPEDTTWKTFESSPPIPVNEVETLDQDPNFVPKPFEPYEVVAITDKLYHSPRCYHYDDEANFQTFIKAFPNLGRGVIIFKRRDNERIPLSQFANVAALINVMFCGCYSPQTPIQMMVMHQNGKSLLYLEFDTESG